MASHTRPLATQVSGGYALKSPIHPYSPGDQVLWVQWATGDAPAPHSPLSITLEIVAKANEWGRWHTYNALTLPTGDYKVGAGKVRLRLANGDDEEFYCFGGDVTFYPHERTCRFTSRAPILHLNPRRETVADELMDEAEAGLARLALLWDVTPTELVRCLRRNYAPLIVYLATLESIIERYGQSGALHDMGHALLRLAFSERGYYQQEHIWPDSPPPPLEKLAKRCDG